VGWDLQTPKRTKEHHITQSAKERNLTTSPVKSVASFDRKSLTPKKKKNSPCKIPLG
jgi:hypothetical protein